MRVEPGNLNRASEAEGIRVPTEPGLDALWSALTDDLPPDMERMLRRVIKAHVRLLAEMVKIAEAMEHDRTQN